MVLSFFQSPPKLFSRITNNNTLEHYEYYLLRDRRDCCPKMDYIVVYVSSYNTRYRDLFVKLFMFACYKTPLETEWRMRDKFYTWFDNKKLFTFFGEIPIPKSMINNPSVDPEKSATIYKIPGLFDITSGKLVTYGSSYIKTYISNAIKEAIQVNPSLKNELPADLIQTMVQQDSNKGGKRPTRRHLKTKSNTKTRKSKKNKSKN